MPANTDKVEAFTAKALELFSKSLSSIGVKNGGVIGEDVTDFGKRLNHAGLVVHMHHRD
jgi:hypothetical protein